MEACKAREHRRDGTDEHEKNRFVVERGSVRVVLVFSTCGGTGSSLAFDLAYLSGPPARGEPEQSRHRHAAVHPDKAIKNENRVSVSASAPIPMPGSRIELSD